MARGLAQRENAQAGSVYANSAFLLSESESQEQQGDRVITRALLFYEGKHQPMSGRAKTYSRKELEKIVAATNNWIGQGRRVKLYASDADHLKISQSAVVGYVEGQLWAKEIAAEDLPMSGLTDLVGKVGIFANVAIAGVDNVAQYRDGRLKELSVGINGDGTIVEVSAVSIPALAGAALFSAPLDEEEGDRFALTLSSWMDKQRKKKDMSSLSELFEGFGEVLGSLESASPEQLGERSPDEYRASAIDELASQLRGRLGVRNPEPLPTVPMFGGKPMDTDKDAFVLQQEKFAAEQAQFAREKATFSQYGKLKSRGDALLKAGKLTPAEFKSYFEDDDAAIAHFSQAEHHEKLSYLEFHFKQLEQFGVAAQLDSKLKDEPLPGDKGPTEQQVEDEAKRLFETAQRFSSIF